MNVVLLAGERTNERECRQFDNFKIESQGKFAPKLPHDSYKNANDLCTEC